MIHLCKKAIKSPHWEWMPGMLTYSIAFSNDKIPVRMSELTKNYILADPSSCTTAETNKKTLIKYYGYTAKINDQHRIFDLIPDLEDPGTLGCILHLVRKAWGMKKSIVVYYSDNEWKVSWSGSTHGGICGTGATEGEALLTALLNAPK